MRKFRVLSPILCLAVLLGGRSALAEGDAGVMPLAPHHAVYKLRLLKATGAKAPEGVDGLMSYDFTGSSCDGYSTTLRQMTALQPQEGEARVSEMQSATFEAGDGHDYRFHIDNKGAGDGGTVDGSAHKQGDAAGAIALQQPKAEKIDLPAGVLYPTEHMKRVLATARAGGKLLSASVFDGSDTGKKVFTTLTVVGAKSATKVEDVSAGIETLKDMPRWPVTISYFDSSKPDGAPDYVLSFDLYENGISRALKLDYGDFVLAGDLQELKLQPVTPCK